MTTTTKKENLSAFLDDESGNFEQRRLLDELQKDDELLETLSCYTLIGDAMRQNQNTELVMPPSDFLAGIHDRLEKEPNYDHVYIEQQKAETSRAWLKPAAGFAIAASVVTAITLNLFPTLNNSNPESQAITTASNANLPATVVSASSDAQPLFMAQSTMKARLQRYIKSHVESTPNSAVMPSVRSFTHAEN